MEYYRTHTNKDLSDYIIPFVFITVFVIVMLFVSSHWAGNISTKLQARHHIECGEMVEDTRRVRYSSSEDNFVVHVSYPDTEFINEEVLPLADAKIEVYRKNCELYKNVSIFPTVGSITKKDFMELGLVMNTLNIKYYSEQSDKPSMLRRITLEPDKEDQYFTYRCTDGVVESQSNISDQYNLDPVNKGMELGLKCKYTEFVDSHKKEVRQ